MEDSTAETGTAAAGRARGFLIAGLALMLLFGFAFLKGRAE